MRPERELVPRAKDAWVWLGGILLLGLIGGGVTVAAVTLWENIDIRQLTPGLALPAGPLPEPAAAMAPAEGAVPFTAVIFASERNRAYFPDSTYHDRELDRWRRLVVRSGGLLRDAADAAELASLEPSEVLVLAESPCMSEPELGAVRAHLSGGGSLVASWAVGVRDEACAWGGWEPLLELTGAEEVQEIAGRDALFLTVPGGVALSPGLDPGTRIEVRPDPSLALRAEGARVFWSDWALNPAPDEGGLGADVAAAARRLPSGGRTAWFGMRLGQAITPADSARLERLVRNGVLWAAGAPLATPSAWPDGERAALVFALDVEDQPSNAGAVAAAFVAARVPGTFFAVTQLVSGDAALAEALGRAGEIGSQTADHTPLGGLTAQDQLVRLRRSWSDVEEWSGTAPTGLRPPEEAFDSTTLQAWRRAGGTYLVARNDSRSGSPELHPTADGPVVLLPRLVKDDYNVIVQDQAIRAVRIGEAFVRGTRKMHAIGGIAIVAGHTQIMQSEARIESFRVAAEAARTQGGWWIASGGDVAAWWIARSEVAVDFVPPDGAPPVDPSLEHAGLPDLLVHAPAGSAGRDVWVDVTLPAPPADARPLVDGRSVAFVETEWGVRVPVGVLEPDDERRVSFAVPVARTAATLGPEPATPPAG